MPSWPPGSDGRQVGGFACGMPVGVDTQGVETGVLEGLGVHGCLLGDLGQVTDGCPRSGSPGWGQLPPSPRVMIRRLSSASPACRRHAVITAPGSAAV